jgi:hypothetical protein
MDNGHKLDRNHVTHTDNIESDVAFYSSEQGEMAENSDAENEDLCGKDSDMEHEEDLALDAATEDEEMLAQDSATEEQVMWSGEPATEENQLDSNMGMEKFYWNSDEDEVDMNSEIEEQNDTENQEEHIWADTEMSDGDSNASPSSTCTDEDMENEQF